MNELSLAEQSVSLFLRNVVEGTRLDLTFRVTTHPGETPALRIEFRGPDTKLLMASGGDLLESLRYLAGAASGLDMESGQVVDVAVVS